MTVEVGDIILYPIGARSEILSRAIALGQRLIKQAPSKESYSHVAIVGPDTAHQYEAWFPRIRKTDIRLDGTEVYRMPGMTPATTAMMMAYCASEEGRLYDWLSLVTLGMFHLGGTEVCSELAYGALLSTGLLGQGPGYFETPDDIAALPELMLVK